MRKIGYLRVSTDDQTHDRQLYGLKPLCDELYIETLSAVSKTRPLYRRAVDRLRPGDYFVVWDIDRAYRDTRDALNEIHALDERGVHIQIVASPFDTTTDEGYLHLTVRLAVSQYERKALARRTREGLAAARRNGKTLGRPRKLTRAQAEEARQLLADREIGPGALAKQLEVGRSTLDRAIRRLTTPCHTDVG